MKITVKLVCGKHERTAVVACGNGNKTFKWLGMVASQRFAHDAPHGALRRHDELRGINDRVQQLPYAISLLTGENPQPHDLLSDYLRDEDEVIINLMDDIRVDNCGSPSLSKWSTMAFTTNMDDMDNNSQDGLGMSHSPSSPGVNALNVKPDDFKAKTDFMRIVLGSQMLDLIKIAHQLNVHWAHVVVAMPKLSPTEASVIKEHCRIHFGVLFELFQHFSPNGKMTLKGFQDLMDEAEAYPARDFEFLSKKDFRKASEGCGGSDLNFGGFLCALMLSSQATHIDTLDKAAKVYSPSEAFEILLSRNIIPLAHHYRLPFIIRETFCSDECLYRIRGLHDMLYISFEKYAVKSNRDHPTTINAEVMTELLYDAQLQDEGINPRTIVKTQQLLAEVKRGIIIGRSVVNEADYDRDGKAVQLIPPADNEFTYAEFVDVGARAGITKYFVGEHPPNMIDCIMAGLRDVSSAQHKVVPTKQSTNKR